MPKNVTTSKHADNSTCIFKATHKLQFSVEGIYLETMGLKWVLLPVLALYWFSIVSPVAAYKVVCYYGSWAVYRPGDGKFDVEDIDPNICTHIIFGFTGLNSDGTVRILDSWNEVDKAALKRFSCLKKLNPNLKSLIAIGGWNEGSTGFSNVARDSAKRATLIRSAIDLIGKYEFDGFDLDWEYPNQRGGIPADVANFVQLVKEFSAAFKPKGLLLTAAVAACQASASQSYDILQISNYLDFINVMTYDLHGCWEIVAGHNAPLRNSPDGLDVETCMSFWLNGGAPREKLILGIGLYGRSFRLKDSNDYGIGAPAPGCGTAGPITREAGILGYNEICKNNWPRTWHSEQVVPYAVQGDQWVGYDDPESIGHKINYLKSKGLGGAMVWSLETDDFKAACGLGRNPLLNAIRKGLGLPTSTGNGWQSPCANSTIIWWVPEDNGGGGDNPGNDGGGGDNPGSGGGSNPADPPAGPICSKTGYVRDSVNCATFYYCQANGGTWAVSTFQCGDKTYYDPDSGVCNWIADVKCP